MNPCIVIPHYNHEAALPGVLSSLTSCALPVIVVDDGSTPVSRNQIAEVIARQGNARLVMRKVNGGKGAAMRDALARAGADGFTHALQVDADGQHDVSDVPALLEMSRQHPDALVSGAPVFSDDMPRARRWGRQLTHACVALETLSRRVGDTMCGFRVYPVERICALLEASPVGDKMDFDIEVMVRADWAGIPIRHVPTRVRYPQDGVSHFHYLSDNLRITAMHTRLILGMLPRAPRLVARWFRA